MSRKTPFWWRNPLKWLLRWRRRHYERGYSNGWDDRQGRVFRLEQDIDRALSEIGVPGEGYPANVANAYKILSEAVG